MAYPGSYFKDWLAEQASEAKRQLVNKAAQLAGVGEVGLTIGTGLAADVVGGTNAALSALAGRPDPGQHVENARDAFTYMPRTDYGRQYMGEIGSGIQKVGEGLAELPGADSVREGWYDVTTKAPMVAAVGSGIAQTFAPGGRVAGKADDVARVALRATDFAPTEASAFRAAINDARAKMPKTDAAQVSPLPDDFVGKTFLAPDGKSGFAVDQGGELIALFRHPDAEYRGVMDAALARGRAEGATHLSAFDLPGKLAEGYGKRGAVERERAAWNDEFAPDNWPYAELGKPDYVTMDLAEPAQMREAAKGPISPDLLKNLGDEDSMQVFTHSNLAEDPGRVREIKRYQPPRGAPAYAQRLAKNEDAYNQLLEWARQGMDEDGIGWYNTEEMRQAFVRELGEKEGNSAYELYIDLVAATSAGAKTPANAKIAGRYYHLARRGEPIVQAPKGSGYGHKAQNLHLSSAKEIIGGKGGLLEIENPKRYTFAENLKGNWKYVTVDKHNVRALAIASKDPEMMLTKLADGRPRKDKITGKAKNPPGPPEWWDAKVHGKWDPATFNPREWIKKNRDKVEWDQLPPTWFKEAPTKTDYAMLESITMRLAEDLGVTPAQAQAALWLGAGSRTGLGSPPKAFAKIFDDRIKATAKRDGITPKQALSDVIHARRMLGRADPNLLAVLGAGGLAAGGIHYGKQYIEDVKEKQRKRRRDLLRMEEEQ